MVLLVLASFSGKCRRAFSCHYENAYKNWIVQRKDILVLTYSTGHDPVVLQKFAVLVVNTSVKFSSMAHH